MSLTELRVVTKTGSITALLAALAVSVSLWTSSAFAADAIFVPGEPIVTGFSGVVPPASPPSGTDPLDRTFINPDGQSMVIQKLQPDGAPSGQLIDSPAAFSATAKDVGQVFGVTLDDAPDETGALAPNIYLAATSAYGLNIVVPGPDGQPVRSKLGAAGATFMAGQWGAAGGAGGFPGSIWKVDGTTGEISLFSTIAANTAAGLGGIVYDPASAQFFVSDLDTGLIYRLGHDGTIADSFDHGVTARPTHGLAAVPDDGSTVDITNPAFDSQDPSTWGITQPERKVTGLAMHNGRLYYAVADGPAIWSVGIKADGSFGTPRWELDVTGLSSTNEITGIVFDPAGRMILAQRGGLTTSYDYSVFAEPGTSSVVRYTRELPDDPATPSVWRSTPDSYAIGLPDNGTAASGGVALGYGFNATVGDFSGSCSATVWATGDGLRANPGLTPPVDGPMQVAGLQGMARTLVRPANDPAVHSVFTDYDGNTDDSTANEAGHVGAVAVWQVCGGPSSPPDIEPPDDLPPPDFIQPPHFNLSLEKWSAPYFCFDGGANYWCNYTIRVENTGTVPYWGPVHVHDYLPANPPGASMSFWPTPPWACGPSGASSYDCAMGPVLLYPGDGVVLHETVKLPKPVPYCQLANVAGIAWPFFLHDENPSDDFDGAFAGIPSPVPGCVPPPGPGVADLALTKFTFPSNCIDSGPNYTCNYGVLVQNAGPGPYSGPITVKDTLAANLTATIFGAWTCGQAGPVLTCHINTPPVNAPPGWGSAFFVQVHVKKPVAPPACDLPNKATITAPLGGSPSNIFAGNDSGAATTHIPSPACLAPATHTDLKMQKTALGCFPFGINYACKWQMTLTNVGPDTYVGPLSFKDVSAFATSNWLTLSPLGCSGTSDVTCNPVGPAFLPSGASIVQPFYTFYAGGPSTCSATNNLSIITPSPGSVQNPAGNDSASATQPIPNPACAGLPNLVITKTAKGCASDPSSPNWLCKFDVSVKNIGAVAQPAPIKVLDYNLKPTTFTGAACVPGVPNSWQCTKPTPLAAGATWSFQATTHVDPNGVTLADCNVINSVWITTPFSFDPGHFAQATQKVPQLFVNLGPGPELVYCDPPSLKLSKTAGKSTPSGDGYDVAYTVTATSTGPDPYHGTVEVDEALPAGTSYVSSSWACTPATGNDMHCSSPHVDLAVGQSTSMNIVIHVPKPIAVRDNCAVTNTVNVSISAAVLHSDKGAQYTASATAKLPGDACAKQPACPPTQLKPGGGCCDPGLVWNGKQCAPPKPVTPPCRFSDSSIQDGVCLCDPGSHGKPGQCVPDKPIPPPCKFNDSSIQDGVCLCDPGSHGKPGRCVPDQPVPPPCRGDNASVQDGVCLCDPGFHGKPPRCVPDQPTPPPPPPCDFKNASVQDGVCLCDPGFKGRPPRCVPDQPTPPPPPPCRGDNASVQDGVCLCNPGFHGQPPRCIPDQQQPPINEPIKLCPTDSHFDRKANACVCNPPLRGKPGECVAVILRLPPVTNLPVIK